MKNKKYLVLLALALTLFFISTNVCSALDFYRYADPDTISARDREVTTIYWVFEYGHDCTVTVKDSNGTVVKTLASYKWFGDGENTITWNGSVNTSYDSKGYAPNGKYKVVVTPQDEWRQYQSIIEVTVENSPEPDPPKLDISLTTLNSLTPDGNNYKESPFTVSATIRNTGGQTATSVNARLTLSSGLSTLDSANNYVGSIGSGQSKTVIWRVNAKTNIMSDRTDKVTITATSSNASSDSNYRFINVPGLVVIFIPGMAGTNLKNADGDQVWFTPGWNDYDDMAMRSDGTPVNSLTPGTPVNFIWGYSDIVEYLDQNYNLKVFTYDWRLSNEQTVQKLEQTITNTGASKVYIVAHSMGGLVANRYITKGNASKIAKLVTIATPYFGSPKALYTLETGDLELTGSDADELREIGKNCKSAYELLPSRKYFSLNDSDPANDTYYFRKWKVDAQRVDYKDFDKMLNYLNNGHPNLTNGFAQAADNFQKNLNVNLTGVDAYFIVGYGQATMGLIEDKWVYKKSAKGWVLDDVRKIKYINGDGTVPFISANRGKQIGKSHTWYAVNSHVSVLDNDNVHKQINEILTGGTKNHLNTTFDPKKSWYALTINSPVDLQVVDGYGNHLGRGDDEIERNISDSGYYEWGHNKFAVVPEGSYNILLNGTGNGTFTYTLDYYQDDEIVKTVVFKDVAVQEGTVASSNISNTYLEDLTLRIDYENDGIIDKEVTPTGILDESACNDVIAPTVNFRTEGTKGNNDWYVSDIDIFVEASDEGGSGLNTVDYQLNDGNIEPYNEPLNIVQEGITNIKAVASDTLGNTSALLENNFKVDKTTPEIIVSIEDEYSYGTIINLGDIINVSDNVSGVFDFKVYYDNNIIETNELLLDQGGTHTIKISAEDNAGNIGEVEKTIVVSIPAEINFDPDTFNNMIDNPAVATVYIKFPNNFDVKEIDLSSILLNGVVSPIDDLKLGYVQSPVSDYDNDGQEEYMVKFYRSELSKISEPGDGVEIEITGRSNGIPFKGKDFIHVIN